MTDDVGIEAVSWLRHPIEVRLVEFTSSIGDKWEVLPFRFTPDLPDVPYESVVVLLSPADWARRNELKWPSSFDPSDLEKVA